MLDEQQIRHLLIYKICYYMAFSVSNNSWMIRLALIWVLSIFKPWHIQLIDLYSCSYTHKDVQD